MKGFLRFIVIVVVFSIIATLICFLFNMGEEGFLPPKFGETKEEKLIKEIDELKNNLDALPMSDGLDDLVSEGVLGDEVDEFIKLLDSPEIMVRVYQETKDGVGTKLIIVPAPDFLDNQIFYYDEDENLVMYIAESNGVGGTVDYYFNDDILLKSVNNLEENVETIFEAGEDILERADALYERYIKSNASVD